jgi:iron complex outermembrane receptor protein
LSRHQNVIWGFGYDVSAGSVRDYVGLDFNPDDATDQNYDVFFQDELRLWRSVLLTFGSKFERNNYTGFETEPNVRASWMIDRKNTLWASVARAVRKPTRFDRDLSVSAVVVPPPALTTISFRGNKNFDSEKVVAYEAGYRSQVNERTFFDLAGFYNVYSDLFSIEPQPPFTENDPAPSHTVYPYFFENGLRGESYGVELAPSIQITRWWRIQVLYSYLHERLHPQEGSSDTTSTSASGGNPSHQASLRSSFNLPRHFEVDGGVRYVDNLRSQNVGSYTVADARIGWHGVKNMAFEVIGQNFLMTHHPEFSPGNEVERSISGKVTWDF